MTQTKQNLSEFFNFLFFLNYVSQILRQIRKGEYIYVLLTIIRKNIKDFY